MLMSLSVSFAIRGSQLLVATLSARPFSPEWYPGAWPPSPLCSRVKRGGERGADAAARPSLPPCPGPKQVGSWFLAPGESSMNEAPASAREEGRAEGRSEKDHHT